MTGLLLLTGTGVASFILSGRAGTLAGLLTTVYCGVGVLVAVLSFLLMRHYRAEEVERLELDKIKDKDASAALFETGEDLLRAKRAREQFEKYVVPAWTVLIAVAEGSVAYYLFDLFKNPDLRAPTQQQGLLFAAFFGGFALLQFIVGKYCTGLAAYDGSRLLRPVGSHMMLVSLVSVATTVSLSASSFGFVKFDLHVAHGLTALLALLAVENVISLIMEIYRPRVKGREVRLLFESRLAGLLGQPGGIFKTAATALDYQFGFKVSETWFYRYLERVAALLVLLWFGIFFGSSCFVVLEPHEEGLLERCGKPVAGREVIGPGLHLKMPWPIDVVHRYPSKAINQFHIGYVADKEKEAERVLVWTKPHYAEEYNMLVASRDADQTAGDQSSDSTVPVNLLTASIPVQYEITNVLHWARNHANAAEFLERLAWREIVRYLVSVDVADIMAAGRIQAASELQSMIQAAADQHQLGSRIIFVGLQDIHPPVKVAGSYEDVIGALQERETKILVAQSYGAATVPMAKADARVAVLTAEADRISKVQAAYAEGGQFANQVIAYKASPEVYRRRSYLNTLVDSIAGARKYVIGTTNNQDSYWIDLKDSISDALLDVDFKGQMPAENEGQK
ncbi:MAG: protease modulator HflK [Verrucomicrobiae bacterium]|nr:protease modulator HflK [Verrucomicrobiae bacterium]